MLGTWMESLKAGCFRFRLERSEARGCTAPISPPPWHPTGPSIWGLGAHLVTGLAGVVENGFRRLLLLTQLPVGMTSCRSAGLSQPASSPSGGVDSSFEGWRQDEARSCV